MSLSPRRALTFAALVGAMTLVLCSGSALGHTGPGKATPSNVGKGHPWKSNGCTWSPDAVKGMYDFKHACDHHDGCYIGFPRKGIPTYWVSKDQCDRWFRDDMRESCREDHPPGVRGQPSNRDVCMQWANTYFDAVQRFGGPWYKKPSFVEPGFRLPQPTPLIQPLPQPNFPVIEPIAPIPTQPAPEVRGYHVEDYFLGGTWARTDPNDGTWYRQSARPPNGAYWYPNGLGVGVDCARTAAGYVVSFADGHKENWDTWLHVTDGKWYPSAATTEINSNGLQGLRAC